MTVRSSGSARTRRSTYPSRKLALVVNRQGDIVGYTVCDDVSSRSIEGENPLYLPQAKMYAGACALGPAIRPVWEIADPYARHHTADLAWWRLGVAGRDDDRSPAPQAPPAGGLAVCRTGLPERRRAVDGDLPRARGTASGWRTGDVIGIGIGEVGTLTTGVVTGKADLGLASRRWGAPGLAPARRCARPAVLGDLMTDPRVMLPSVDPRTGRAQSDGIGVTTTDALPRRLRRR